jgi:hypothetical protein
MMIQILIVDHIFLLDIENEFQNMVFFFSLMAIENLQNHFIFNFKFFLKKVLLYIFLGTFGYGKSSKNVIIDL